MKILWLSVIVAGLGGLCGACHHQGPYDPPPSPPGPANQEPSFIFQNEIDGNNPIYPY